MPRPKPSETQPVCRNKSAFHEYFIEERFEAGLVLVGSEVKSLREGRADLKDAYALIEGGEAYLVHMRIQEWTGGTFFNHSPERKRKLLLHKKQIEKLRLMVDQRGYALIPLQVYFNEKNRAKVELGLARGKKKYDKREAIRERDERRAAEREGERR
jgi:SsrA-binding protein